MERPAQLVFIPAAGTGHIVPTVEIAKLLVDRYDHLSITVLLMKLPFDKPFNAAADSSISKRIRFVNLPEPQIDTHGPPPSFFTQSVVKAHKNHVKDAVAKLLTESTHSESTPTRVAGLVVDMFCTTMVDVADELGIPSYVFFTSSAACLAFWLQIQTLRDEGGKNVAELMDSDTELTLPSFVNPVPGGVASGVLFKKDLAESFLNQVRRFRQTKGILVNTFMELESGALSSLCDGKTPPVYPVGPLLNLESDRGDMEDDDDDKGLDVLRWLDDQPPLSVVFLCFGSMGFLGEAQTREIACALEQSRCPFLWSLRVAPTKGEEDTMPSDYAHPTRVLPEGFLDRTAEVGKVIGWAPQMAILAHTAVGGFVSHCGWNSTLESLWHNVPVATWPMYAEQQLNAFELVKELGLAVEVRKDNEVVVSAQDIEKGIRQVMKQDGNVRDRVREMSEKSKKALRNGGSSCSFLRRFIDQI